LTSAGLRRIEQKVLGPQPARASQRCAAAEFVCEYEFLRQ
jgi:hypothetical protein